ncbi:MAG: hypothetical protein AAB403_00760 [Planctomycetota bacterium]
MLTYVRSESVGVQAVTAWSRLRTAVRGGWFAIGWQVLLVDSCPAVKCLSDYQHDQNLNASTHKVSDSKDSKTDIDMNGIEDCRDNHQKDNCQRSGDWQWSRECTDDVDDSAESHTPMTITTAGTWWWFLTHTSRTSATSLTRRG